MDQEQLIAVIREYYSSYSETSVKKLEKKALRKVVASSKSAEEKDMYLEELKRVFDGYAVKDWVDEEACCYEFHVLLHHNQDLLDDDVNLIKELGGIRYDLLVYISTLAPYCFFYIDKTQYTDEGKWFFSVVDNYSDEMKSIVKSATSFFENKGYRIVSADLACKIIPDIESQYKSLGSFSIFNGLFSDLLNHYQDSCSLYMESRE